MLTQAQAREILQANQVLVDIGQIDQELKKSLRRWIKAGRIITWRGHWYPVAGASYGLGPAKTCYGTKLAQASC
jgi:hypothetical protein